jgi:murein DD-endopeptidase MepM/ murein hydrolase activator NlpD
MRKKISFYILNNTGSPVKHLTVSEASFYLASLCVTVFVVVLAYVVFDYCQLKTSLSTIQDLEKNISDQTDEITSQRSQVQKFANEINMLKSKLVALNNFEKKIRVIARIEKSDDQDSLFGIGGSIPEDIDSQVPLTKKHNSLMREMHAQTEQLELASTTQKKGFESLLKYLEDQRDLLSSTPAIRPTKGWITSRFGYRKSPFTGLREFHKGYDIANQEGTPIIATADGVVSFIGTKGLMGKLIMIDHGHGLATQFAHIQKALKKRGETVKRGDTIALMGNTGRSTGPHLHYMVFLNGIPVNPVKYILN